MEVVDFVRLLSGEWNSLLQLPNAIAGAKRDLFGRQLTGRRVVVDIDNFGGATIEMGFEAGSASVETEGVEEERGKEKAAGYKVERHYPVSDWCWYWVCDSQRESWWVDTCMGGLTGVVGMDCMAKVCN